MISVVKKELSGLAMVFISFFMRRFCTMLLLIFAIHLLAIAQPQSPVEPKAPAVEQKNESNTQNTLQQDDESQKYPAIVVFVNGSKIRGSLLLKNERISAICSCGNAACELNELIASIKHIEFTHWKRDASSRRFRHSATVITLRDGSKFNCARIPAFDRFALKRERKTHWCYTTYYADASDKQKPVTTKVKKRHNAKSRSDESPKMKTEPHPDAVRKIEFLRDEGKSIFDLLPFMMK